MTPQELKLLDELFDRLASLESAPRDPDAVRAINEGLQRAPNALYPLVQTALVQDEALKQADARIRELEAELGIGQPQPPQQGGFLDSMRDALMGKREPQEQRGSVPSVRAGAAADAPQNPWRNTAGMPGGGYRQEPGYAAAPPQQAPGMAPGIAPGMGGGSFLGTAAATAAGVVGGALLANSFRGMFGGGQGQGQGQSHSAFDSAGSGGGSPWGGNLSGSDLAREAGVNDISGGGRTAAYDDRGGSDRAGLFDVAQNDADVDDGDYDDGGDFGGDDGGSDEA
ncbi:MAG: DUF2076 domain-containing protein [Xanthobacteraceae bacterium]|nr:DUF2076 domain-containing protein [Xanthobacteraceae bacterium]